MLIGHSKIDKSKGNEFQNNKIKKLNHWKEDLQIRLQSLTTFE
jgi:hypothetical protein